MSEKLRYEIDISSAGASPASSGGPQIRTVAPADLTGLAKLMLDAYVGTIDYDDENLDDAMDEVRSFLEDGNSRLDNSWVVESDGEIISAVLVSMSRGRPFIAYVMTLSSHKQRGLARLVVTHAMSRLAADGYKRVFLYTTDGNIPSENLFRSVGAVQTTS